jgi:4-hydroxy-tetrahydrodipicolinate synthase
MTMSKFAGVIAAAVTPLNSRSEPDLAAFPQLLDFLQERGNHGALILGTTGEGPSFSVRQRQAILRAAIKIKVNHPDFLLLAGTGTPSLDETILLTRFAFNQGYDAVVVLPPYYFKKTPAVGLQEWFSMVIEHAVPKDKFLFAYHIPQISGVPITIELMENLHNRFPSRFAGIKDSSGDSEFAKQLGHLFGENLRIFTGNDRLFSTALENHAAGCITALANIASPILNTIWSAYQSGQPTNQPQTIMNGLRQMMDDFGPAPTLLKFLLSEYFQFSYWTVMPPLLESSSLTRQQLLTSIKPFEEHILKQFNG